MSFGTKYIPSVTAVTGFDAADIIKYEAHNRQTQIEDMQLFQRAQKESTIGLADAITAALNQQAEVEKMMAGSYIGQGVVGVATPAVGMGYRGYRSQTSELGKINEEQNNLSEWRDTLKGKNADIVSGNNPAQEAALSIKDAELDGLRNKTFKNSSPHDDAEEGAVEIASSLRSARKVNNEENEVINKGKLYDDLNKKLDKEEDGVQNARQRYETKTDRIEHKLESLLQGASNVVAGMIQTQAAKDREIQAELEGEKQYSQYLNDSINQNVQSSQKAFDDMNQNISLTIQNYYTNLARANQPV